MTPPYKVSESLVARLDKTSMGESISISISIMIIGVIFKTVVVIMFTFSKLCELLKSLTVAASVVVVGPLKAVEEGDDDSNFKANDDLYFDRAVSLLIALTPLPRVTVTN